MSITDKAVAGWIAEHPLDGATKMDISRANADLYGGPLYLDADGEHVTMWDDGATAFDFVGACERIGDALADVPSLFVVDWVGVAEEIEPEWSTCPECDGAGEDDAGSICPYCWEGGIEPEPYYRVDRAEVIAAIVGTELARHVA